MTDIPADALRISWDDACAQSLKLAELIEQHCAQTGERFDAIIVIPRGSYYPVNIIARSFGFGALDLIHASISSYQEGGTLRAEFKLGQMPTDDEVAGKNLLIIDEVCDSGHTLKYLVDKLGQQGAALIRTGVLHYKPAQTQTNFEPDWYVDKTDKWIVYPWEDSELSAQKSHVKRV